MTETTTNVSDGARSPRVLLLYYSYTGQSQKVLDVAGEVFRDRGCDVQTAAITFTYQRYAEKFSRFPM
ncbi:MAG: flavodoxin family protein, partial [Mycobacterium sp.]